MRYESSKRGNVGLRDVGALPKGEVIHGSNDSGEFTRGTDPTTLVLLKRREYPLFVTRWRIASATSVLCSVWWATLRAQRLPNSFPTVLACKIPRTTLVHFLLQRSPRYGRTWIVPLILALLPMHFHRSNPFFVNTKIRTCSVCVLCPPRKSSSLSGPYRRNRAPWIQCQLACSNSVYRSLLSRLPRSSTCLSLLALFLPAKSTPSSDLSSRSQLSIATSWATTARFRISHFYQNSSKKRS